MNSPAEKADAEYAVLSTDLGRSLIEQVGRVAAPRPADLHRWRAIAPAELVQAAIRLVDCRRRAANKYARADAMWLEPTGLEQATAEVVARYKATRFQCRVVVDFCSGIGGDSLALAEGHDVLSVDRDPGMCRRLAWNAGVYGVGDRVLPLVGDVERFSIPPGAWVHIDPDRRPGGLDRSHRAKRVDDYVPGVGFLKGLCREANGAAIKLGPASDFDAHFSGTGLEIELISLHGECKEATVWAGGAVTCRSRATRLPEGVTWTDRDGAGESYAGIRPESDWTWIYDPDPALCRSGLLDSFAIAHDLGRIAGDVDYLAGDTLVRTPFLTPFEVIEVFPLDVKILRRELASREIGSLEIKVRGAGVAPEQLRPKLKLEGPKSATLLLAGKGPTRAILARRAGSHGLDL